jgi:hypothetical protein
VKFCFRDLFFQDTENRALDIHVHTTEHISDGMHCVVFYEVWLLCLRADFLSQKDSKVLFEIDVKDRQNILNVYSTVLMYKLFLRGQTYWFKSAKTSVLEKFYFERIPSTLGKPQHKQEKYRYYESYPGFTGYCPYRFKNTLFTRNDFFNWNFID